MKPKTIDEIVEEIFDTEYIGGNQPNLNKEYIKQALTTDRQNLLSVIEEVNPKDGYWKRDSDNADFINGFNSAKSAIKKALLKTLKHG